MAPIGTLLLSITEVPDPWQSLTAEALLAQSMQCACTACLGVRSFGGAFVALSLKFYGLQLWPTDTWTAFLNLIWRPGMDKIFASPWSRSEYANQSAPIAMDACGEMETPSSRHASR
jgi:hypothetical protein